MFGAVYFLWRLCRQITALNSTLFLLFFGLAFVTKFSAVLLIPIFWMTVLGKIISPQTWSIGVNRRREIRTRTGRLAILSAVFVAVLLTAFFMIWVAYGFPYSAAADSNKPRRPSRKCCRERRKKQR